MQIPTIKLRNKATGATKIVNQTAYALDLSKWQGWEIISMRGGSATDRSVAMERGQEIIERERARNPKSPAYGDAQRAYEARAVTTATQVAAPPTDNAEYTQAVAVTDEKPVAPAATPVATIGDVQTVSEVSSGPRRGRPPVAKKPAAERQEDILS